MKGPKTLILLIIASFVIIPGYLSLILWNGLENRAFDVRLRVLKELKLGNNKPSGRVVVVGLDEKLQTRDKPLLFWYPEFGHFFRLMAKFRASVVGFDFVPNQSLAAKLGAAGDELTGQRLTQTQRIALAEVGRNADMGLTEALKETGKTVPVVQGVEEGLLPFYYSAMIDWEKVTPGLLRFYADPDFEVRRFNPAPEGGLEPFAAALYARISRQRPSGEEKILNYLLAQGIPVISLYDVLGGKIDPGKFDGKAVILCYLSKTEDMHATPLGRFPGGIIHAVALETILTGTAFVPASSGTVLFTIVLLTIVSFAAAIRLRPLPANSFAFLLSGAYAVINTAILAKGVLLPLFPAVLIPIISMTACYPYRYLVEERQRKQIYRAFSYYTEPKLLDSIIAKDPGSLLKGERKDICIFFLDVRNFTELSHARQAQDIIAFLNLFFGRITEVIQRRDGFVNKFMGDGLMAFFMTGENPVSNAVSSAREVLSIINEINTNGEVRPYLGDWEVAVGIGINFGSVILGNVGSERKMDFTIIGDPVNIASRIEGLTKTVGQPLLISGTAYEKVRNNFVFECVGTHEVKGVNEPLTLYTLRE